MWEPSKVFSKDGADGYHLCAVPLPRFCFLVSPGKELECSYDAPRFAVATQCIPLDHLALAASKTHTHGSEYGSIYNNQDLEITKVSTNGVNG